MAIIPATVDVNEDDDIVIVIVRPPTSSVRPVLVAVVVVVVLTQAPRVLPATLMRALFIVFMLHLIS